MSNEMEIDVAIVRTEDFFKSLGIKIRLSDWGIGEETIDTIVRRFEERRWNVGESGIVSPEKVKMILERVK